MRDRPNFGALTKPRSLSLVNGYKHNQKFSKIKFRNKNQLLGLWKNTGQTIFKNAHPRVFIQFFVRMELYEIVWQEVSHVSHLEIVIFGQIRHTILPKRIAPVNFRRERRCFF